MSAREVVSASTAMISDATVMSKPVTRVSPASAGPCPMVMRRRWRSHVSTTRCHVMVAGSMFSRTNLDRSSAVMASGSAAVMPSLAARRFMTGLKNRLPSLSAGNRRANMTSSVMFFSWNMRVSMAAASRLLAAVMAWMSPVRCRLNSSMGMTCAYPPPCRWWWGRWG